MTMEANIDDIELQPQFRSVGGKLNVNHLAPIAGFRIPELQLLGGPAAGCVPSPRTSRVSASRDQC